MTQFPRFPKTQKLKNQPFQNIHFLAENIHIF